MSSVIEEYLEAIYRLQERHEVARTGDLVEKLKVSPGTITNTIERLERMLLVVHEPYRGVQLTEKGRKIALSVLRKHRLLEKLLFDILGIEWCSVHEHACNLEHWINEHIARRIEYVLGSPKKCPHGNPIPSEDNKIFEECEKMLAEINLGEKVVVSRILEEEPATLRYLEEIRVKPESLIEVIEKRLLNDLMIVRVNDKVHALDRKIASLIMVKET
ncbi:MAG: metal-dependent transcriptional regulator [Candidatus Bathyarchaeia archaeon]